MKILFAISPIHPGFSASSLLFQQMRDLAQNSGHEVASFSNESLEHGNWQGACLNRILPVHDEGKTIEETLYNAHVLSSSFLKKDFTLLKRCTDSFHPDLIIDLGRPAASILARQEHIPVYAFMDAAMFKNRSFASDCLNDLNRFLREHDQEQILRCSDLFEHATLRFGFGPSSTQPFTEKEHVLQFSSMCTSSTNTPGPNRVVLFFEHPIGSPRHTKNMIVKAFKGAPYDIYACVRGVKDDSEENLHWMEHFRPECLSGAKAVLHDGNAFLMNQSILHGLPQVIIHDASAVRSWNGAAITRSHCGLALYDKECTMETLYETYRHLMSDDSYTLHARRLQSEALLLPGLEAFPFKISKTESEEAE